MGTKVKDIETLINEIRERQETIQKSLPFNVWTTFGKIDSFGTQLSFGDNDYKDISEVKEALEYLVKSFGGIIKWKKSS